MPTDFSGQTKGSIAAKCDVEIVKMSDSGDNLIDFLSDKQGLKLMGAFQAFAQHVGAVSRDMDFSFLQELQDEFGDLVPNHRDDGDDVEKFFQRVSPVMTVHA